MTAHAAAIAEKLQGAHERWTGKRREDKDMDEASVWVTKAENDIDNLIAAMNGIKEALSAPGGPQASAVSAERVVELENKVHGYDEDRRTERDRANRLEAQLAEADARKAELERELMDASVRAETFELDAKAVTELLATAYVPREVPWSDVAAGMMTIARDGTPWMVESWIGTGAVRLRNGETTFDKAIDASQGETVRVLVPYVTDAQAEATLRAAGATEVGS